MIATGTAIALSALGALGGQAATTYAQTHSANKTADKIADREATLAHEQMAQRQQVMNQLLPLLGGRTQQRQQAFNPWIQMGMGANDQLGQMLNRPQGPQGGQMPQAPQQNPWPQLYGSLPR